MRILWIYFTSIRRNRNNINTLKMHQRLPIALAQVKNGNASKNLLNKIFGLQIVYSLYRVKKITKKGYINLMNSL